MKDQSTTRLSIIALATALLASCGGGGTSSGDVTASGSASSAAGATFADCFKLTPGVKFVKTNDYKELIVQEPFEGVSTTGMMELRADDTRFGGLYVSVGANDIQILGEIDYSDGGVYDGKDVYSGYHFAANLAAGQTVTINFTDTATRVYPTTTTSTTAQSVQLTFAGFEDLTLANRSFTNVCKLTSPVAGSTSGETSVSWFAKDFGVIRSEKQDAQGVTVPNSRIELASIIQAP